MTSEANKYNSNHLPASATVWPRAPETIQLLGDDASAEAVLEALRKHDRNIKFSDLIQPIVQAQVRAEVKRLQCSRDEEDTPVHHKKSLNKHSTKEKKKVKSNDVLTLDDFSQSTSFHGFRYFIHSGTTLHRRLLWLIAWLASVALLALLVNEKVRYLNSYPSTVDIWDDHVTSLPFPAVTVCHRNLYRLSRTHELGVYDALQMMNDARASDYRGYVYNASTCTIPVNAFFSQTIASTSIAVCERLCNDTHLYSTYCSGFFWQRADKSCILTSYTGQSETSDCTLTNSDDRVMFFRRLRPWRQQPLYCTFDEEPGKAQEACPLVQEQTLTFPHQWLRVAHGEEIASADISTGSKHGRAFILSVPSTSFQIRPLARFFTPLMNTTGKCLLLFRARYFNKGTQGQLKLSIVDEEFAEVANATRDIVHNVVNSYSPLRYEPYFAHLPPGLNMVMFTATGYGNVRIFIDDFSVRPCQDFYNRECLLSAKGNEYMGSLDLNDDREQCQAHSHFSIPHARLGAHGDYTPRSDRCRYSELVGKVACAGNNGSLLKCTVDHCPCADGWFACRSGPCLPLSMFCNGHNDCPENDNSDEDSKHCQQAQQQQHLGSVGTTSASVSISINMFMQPFLMRPDQDPFLADERNIMAAPGTDTQGAVWDKLIKRAEMNSTTFVKSLAHDMNSSLLVCRWQRKGVCKELKPRLTDMGQCYSFNANTSTTIQTKAVGEKSGGLLMIINTESYESLSDGRSGVKILPFDASNDVELMSDHGINLSPGFYTTLAMSANRVEYLEPPYGKCGSIALNHTLENYSYSRCLRDRETNDYISQCKCRNIFMPGPPSEQCPLRQLLTCNRNYSYINPVVCPSHCDGISYETTLSLAAMSAVDFTENFDLDHLQQIQRHFANIRNLHSRITVGRLETFLQTLTRISILTKYVRTAMEKTLPTFSHHVYQRLANFRLKVVAIVNNMREDASAYLINNVGFKVSYESLIHTLSHCNMQFDIMKQAYNVSFFATPESRIAFICAIKPALNYVNLGYDAVQRLTSLVNQTTTNICQPLQKEGTSCFLALSNIAITLMEANGTLNELAEAYRLNASYPYESICKKRDQKMALEIGNLSAPSLLIAELGQLAEQFYFSYSAVSDCYEKHTQLVKDMSLFSVAESGNRDYRDDIGLAEKALSILKKGHGVFDNIRVGILLNKLSLQSAGEIIMASVEDMKSSLEWMRNFIYNRLLITWPDSIQEERNELIDAVHRLLQLLRSANINCNTKGSYRLREFFGRLLSTRHEALITKNKFTMDDIIVALSSENNIADADNVTMPGGDSISVRSIAENCRVGRDEVTWRADMVTQYDEWEARLVSLKGELDDVQNHIEAYNSSLVINDDFVRRNIVVARLFLSEMRVKRTQQNIAYDWFSFLSDFGGSLGLLLGTSVLSFMELLDFAVFRAAACLTRRL